MEKATFYEKYTKRLLDILCAAAAIAVFWWLYLIVALLVLIAQPFKPKRRDLFGR